MKYGFGTAAVAIISALAFVGMVFFPMIRSEKFKLVMQFFVALGVGAMSGDAIFHIIPNILGLHKHAPGEVHDHGFEIPDYTWKLVVAVAALWVLFMFENGLKLFSSKPYSHHHSNSTESSRACANACCMEDDRSQKNEKKTSFKSSELPNIGHVNDDEFSDQPSNQSDMEMKDVTNAKATYFCGITASGIVILLGDILCNFGDGLAIGAAFSYSWPQGLGTSLAVFCHELPREFGDFAIYMKNGLSKIKALMINFTAACFTFIGLYIGLALSENPEVGSWILSFVAGMFLYISFVILLHTLAEERTSYPKTQFLLQNSGMAFGWTILLLIAIYEEPLINSIKE